MKVGPSHQTCNETLQVEIRSIRNIENRDQIRNTRSTWTIHVIYSIIFVIIFGTKNKKFGNPFQPTIKPIHFNQLPNPSDQPILPLVQTTKQGCTQDN